MLTKDYEEIQKKLLKETPKAKKTNVFGRKYMYNSKLRDYSYEKIDKSPVKSKSKSKRSPYKYKYWFANYFLERLKELGWYCLLFFDFDFSELLISARCLLFLANSLM